MVLKEHLVAQQAFGGNWTQQKLSLLSEYLQKYTTIFHGNPNARYFTTFYVDAFAGSGSYSVKDKLVDGGGTLAGFDEPEAEAFFEGSARKALEVEPRFDRYVFIERDVSRCADLANLRDAYPDKAKDIEIMNDDANVFLKRWCREQDWNNKRAVLFLDPFGMEVEWRLLEAIASTHAIDMWLWFPISGVNRHLTRNVPPPEEWADRITRVLGTDAWRSEWYPTRTISTLFGDEELQVKDTDFDRIAAFVVERLKTIFTGVAEAPRPFTNSNNVPLFLFCFATGANKPTARKAALNIADYLLRRG
jgi:three-Cys-motif partner protein